MSDSAMEWAVKRERELRKWSYLECKIRGIVPYFDDSEEQPYDHSDFHSVHADVYDIFRDGK